MGINKEPSEANQFDAMRDRAIEIRTRALDFLENQIEKQVIDTTEAFAKFRSICAFNDALTRNYIQGISSKPQLWRLNGKF